MQRLLKTSGIFPSEIHCPSLWEVWEGKEQGITDDLIHGEENFYTHRL